MKMSSLALTALTVCAFVAAFMSQKAVAQETAGFEVARFVVCEGVTDREPTDVTSTFSAGTERVFAYLEARNIDADTTVDFVWLNEGAEMARVTMSIGGGTRWRTWSSKTVSGMTGDWRVELQGPGGVVITSADFRVE